METSTPNRRGTKNSENISGNALRRLRLEKKLTLKQVADAIGVTIQAISRFERQKGIPNPRRLKQFAVFYQTTPADLANRFYV